MSAILFVSTEVYCLHTIQKTFHDIRNVEVSKLLQNDIHSLKIWCLVNAMKLNVSQTTCNLYS